MKNLDQFSLCPFYSIRPPPSPYPETLHLIIIKRFLAIIFLSWTSCKAEVAPWINLFRQMQKTWILKCRFRLLSMIILKMSSCLKEMMVSVIVVKHFMFYCKLFLEFYGLKRRGPKLEAYVPWNRWILYKGMGALINRIFCASNQLPHCSFQRMICIWIMFV